MGLWQRFTDFSVYRHNFQLPPGQIEEAVNYMRVPGEIDISDLAFQAIPDDRPEANILDSVIDVAIFPLPSECRHRSFCDLSKLGVGTKEDFDGASFVNLCVHGRLALHKDFYQGHHSAIRVPRVGQMSKHVKYGVFNVKEAGVDYEVIIANCSENGRKVRVQGEVLFNFDEDSSTLWADTDVPVYPLISISVFLMLAMCFFRVQCTQREIPINHQYQTVEMVSARPV
jgi:hypothetical protein